LTDCADLVKLGDVQTLATSTKEQLVLAAERLIAEHGVDGVSMLQIGAAAGSANKSVVQYHFGSKDQLVQAIFEYRLPVVMRRRALLIAERGAPGLRDLVECHVRAVLEQSELDGGRYQGFVTRLLEQGERGLFERLPDELRSPAREFNRDLAVLLPQVPAVLRARRIAATMMIVSRAGALRERSNALGQRVLPLPLEIVDLVDGTVGFLEAAVSPAAHDAAVDLDESDVVWPSFF
jgi:AcrR family transcriptional regulator